MGANVKRVKMAAMPETNRLIARLTPLAEVLAAVESAVSPVAAREMDVAAVSGRVLAADVRAPLYPKVAIALSDGWAVRAENTRDAGSYTPAVLPKIPPRVQTGQAMPDGSDSVAPVDGVTVKAGRAEALSPVDPGAGVLPQGGDSDGKTPLRRAGEKLRATDIAVFGALGIGRASVRKPRVRVVAIRGDDIVSGAAKLIASDAGVVEIDNDLARALQDKHSDFIVAIGGTGSGENDLSAATLARDGQLKFHGIGIAPGETSAFGLVDKVPVLLLPGRLDAALAGWLLIGRTILSRLSGAAADDLTTRATLTRKVTSTVGFAEFVPVRRAAEGVEPLAGKYLSLSSLARADGWILIPAESEGYQAGSEVAVRAWP